MQSVAFENTKIELITRNSEIWARGTQIGYALGYANPRQKIHDIYRRNADEFTDTMTAVIDLPTSGGTQKVRVFSLRGAHLIAMFARTEKAKAFRRWVLDILDALHAGGEYARKRHEAAEKALENGREQASDDGRGLSSWRWHKQKLIIAEEYWRQRRQLCLAIH